MPTTTYQQQQQQEYNSPAEFLFVLLLNLFLLGGSLLAYDLIWVRKVGIVFPIIRLNEESTVTLKSLNKILKHNLEMIWLFDPEYWIPVAGIEGFQYLYFQRTMLIIMLVFIALSIFSFFLVPKFNATSLILLDEVFTFGYQFLLTVAYSIIMLWFLKNMMSTLSSMQIGNKTSWIMQHTMHIKGIPSDLTQMELYNNIQKYLTKGQLGSILAFSYVPNYANMLQLQIDQKDYSILLEALEKNEYPSIKSCLLPKSYRSREYLEGKIKEIGDRQIQLMEEGISGSGHAFLAVDNDSAMVELLEKYSSDRARLNCMQETLATPFCGHIEDQEEILMDQTLSEHPHQDGIIAQNATILIKPAPPPIDILFMNFNVTLKKHLFRKIFINICMILLLLFCTTPMSVLQIVGLQVIQSILNGVELQYLTLGLVVGVNSLLLLLIDLGAEWERHTSKALYQKSIYSRCVFYLTMNMLFIPAISFLAVTNLFELLTKDVNNLIPIIQAIYFLSNGRFFAVLILQSACFSFLNYILRCGDLFLAWGSASFAHFKRSQLINYPWLQRPDKMFQYGYFYGLQITILYIVMTFSTNVPIIHFSGAFFFALRHYLDGLCLQTIYREEMNSQNEMVQRAIVSAACSLLPLQLLVLSVNIVSQQSIYVLLTLILIGFTLYCIIYLNNEKYKYQLQKRQYQILQILEK